MASREYLVDVSAYQPSSLASYHSAGAKQVIIKITEGTNYFSPVAAAQIRSAHAHHMYVHGYHFATFGSSVSQAKKEAKHCIARAEKLGISKKRYIACDWETGDGNNVYGGKKASAKAIIAFMSEVHKAEYKVLLYSGASLLRNNIDTAAVIKKFGTCIWIASYPTDLAYSADFNYFPSMDGVAIWQFCDNWKGLKVDGNISLIDLHNDGTKKATSSKTSKHLGTKKERKTGVVYAPIINHDPNWKIKLLDDNGHYMNQYIKTNTRWKYYDVKTIKGMKCYKLGTDKQWAPAKYLKQV